MSATGEQARRSRRRFLAELATVLVLSALFYGLVDGTRVLEWLDIDRVHEIGALFVTMPVTMLLLGLFAWRRHREAAGFAAGASVAQAESRRSDEQFRSLFDHHPHAVFAVNPDGCYTAMNAAAAALTGYDERELAGLRFPALQGDGGTEGALLAAFHRALGGRPQRVDGLLVRKDGERRHVDVTLVPIVVDAVAVGVYVVTADVTEDRRLRHRLGDALAEAEKASAAKTLLLANVSHELRTPLTSVLAGAELLADTDVDAEQAQLLATITRNGYALAALVDNLLELTQLESAQICLEEERVDLRDLLDRLAAEAAPKAAAKGLELRIEAVGVIPEAVLADRRRLQQALGNVLDNAVKFTDHGEVGVRLECHARFDGRVGAVFRIWDTGIGISVEDREHIFGSFTQADPTATRRHGGAGLGLALTCRLVDLMGGDLSLDSFPGAGSTFILRIPLGAADRAYAVRRHG